MTSWLTHGLRLGQVPSDQRPATSLEIGTWPYPTPTSLSPCSAAPNEISNLRLAAMQCKTKKTALARSAFDSNLTAQLVDDALDDR